MNTSHDEYRPVDLDAVMAVHNEKMQKRMKAISQHVNEYDDEPTVSKFSNVLTDEDSQECVSDVISAPNDTLSVKKQFNSVWTVVRGAHTSTKEKETKYYIFKWAIPPAHVRRSSNNTEITYC